MDWELKGLTSMKVCALLLEIARSERKCALGLGGHLWGELLNAARDLHCGRVQHAAARVVLQRRKRPQRVGDLLLWVNSTQPSGKSLRVAPPFQSKYMMSTSQTPAETQQRLCLEDSSSRVYLVES